MDLIPFLRREFEEMISQLGLIQMGELYRDESPQVLTLAVTNTMTTLKNRSQNTNTTKVIPTDQRVDGAAGGIDEGIKNSIPIQVPVSHVETIIKRGEGVTHCEVEGNELHLQVVQQSLMSWNSQTADESSVATMMDIMVRDLRDTQGEGLTLARIIQTC